MVLSKRARARAVELPAWNEALGLPRPFDQQWSLRLQQIMAYETDLLEFGDIIDGSKEVAALVARLKSEAVAEIAAIDAMGGAVKAIETGVLKAKLVEFNTRRLEAIERGEQIVVGVNAFTNSEPSPLNLDRQWKRQAAPPAWSNSAMTTMRFEAEATIFSRNSAPPPPLISLSLESISSAPSTVRSSSGMSSSVRVECRAPSPARPSPPRSPRNECRDPL